MAERHYTEVIILLLCLICCRTKTDYPFKYHFSEDSYKGSSEIFNNPAQNFTFNFIDNKLKPRSGTVSHHMLVSPVIDAWFKELKKQNNDIKNFFIISPKHTQMGNGIVCISSLDWKIPDGRTVGTNKKYITEIKKRLDLKEEPYAFQKEHGIGALVPFINHYYPDAEIIPVAMDEFNKQISVCGKLSGIISEIMKKDEKSFLIISIDFSHRADIFETNKRDKIAESVLNSLNPEWINFMYSDNNVGIFTLFFVCNEMNLKKNHIFFYINSEEFTGKKLDDITSYFFTFQYP